MKKIKYLIKKSFAFASTLIIKKVKMSITLLYISCKWVTIISILNLNLIFTNNYLIISLNTTNNSK